MSVAGPQHIVTGGLSSVQKTSSPADTPWSNPGRARTNQAIDGGVASAFLAASNEESERLIGVDFNRDSSDASAALSGLIASGKVIDGIELALKNIDEGILANGNADNIYDIEMYLTLDGATPVGTNKAVGIGGTPLNAVDTRVYGGPTDKWGLNSTTQLIRDNVVASTFGFIFQVKESATSTNRQCRIDIAELTVYFSDPVVPPEPRRPQPPADRRRRM